MDSRRRPERWLTVQALLFAAVALALLGGALLHMDTPSREALILDGICRQLAANTTEGRQALVSSAWCPPLPVLMRLPFALALPVKELPVASLIVSALFGAGCVSLLLRVLDRWGVGRPRYLFAAAMGLDPAFIGEALRGTSGTAALFFILLSAYGLSGWVSSRNLRSLSYFAFGSALLLLTRFESAPWLAAGFLLLAGDLVVRPALRGQRQAVLILALLPTVYGFGLWVLMNWLIMGDALYFLRSLASPVWGAANSLSPEPFGLTPLHLAAAGVCVTCALAGAGLRVRPVFHLGIMGAGLLAAAFVLHARGWFWNASPLLTALPVLASMTLAHLAVGAQRRPIRLPWVPAVLPVTLLVWSLTLHGSLVAADGELGGEEDARAAGLDGSIARAVVSRSEFSTVFMCGYEAFALQGTPGAKVLLHSLDFNFNKAAADYPGHVLYLLVHSPIGRSGADSVHWKFPGIYDGGGPWTLHAGAFGPWRLYEIVQPPREEARTYRSDAAAATPK